MELLKVTKDIAIRCILFGACSIPKVGQSVSDFSVSSLSWAEKMFSLKELKAFGRPLWTFSGYGAGSGSSGYGDGYGDGSSDYGSSGYGDGDGSSGAGSGSSGYGYGYGDGSSGYGDGSSGYGDGYGDGSGYGKDIDAKILALGPQ